MYSQSEFKAWPRTPQTSNNAMEAPSPTRGSEGLEPANGTGFHSARSGLNNKPCPTERCPLRLARTQSRESQLSGESEPRVELAPAHTPGIGPGALPSSKAGRLSYTRYRGGFSRSSIPGRPIPLLWYLRGLAGGSLPDSLIKEARGLIGMLWAQPSGGREGTVTSNCNPSSRMTCSQA